MTTLLVGFDSAWTPNNSGALVGVLRGGDGSFQELGLPQTMNYQEAKKTIIEWQSLIKPANTFILLDVKNTIGQRPVEKLVSAPVSLRCGGVQPANTARIEMFGKDAPVWHFLTQFGGVANPQESTTDTQVFETYPVLAMIALDWILPDPFRPTGRLPEYNPERAKTFSIHDWVYVCEQALSELRALGLKELPEWLAVQAVNRSPRKGDQDCLDSCICLLIALHLAKMRECLMIGDMDTGYIVVPSGSNLRNKLYARCDRTGRTQGKLVRPFILSSV